MNTYDQTIDQFLEQTEEQVEQTEEPSNINNVLQELQSMKKEMLETKKEINELKMKLGENDETIKNYEYLIYSLACSVSGFNFGSEREFSTLWEHLDQIILAKLYIKFISENPTYNLHFYNPLKQYSKNLDYDELVENFDKMIKENKFIEKIITERVEYEKNKTIGIVNIGGGFKTYNEMGILVNSTINNSFDRFLYKNRFIAKYISNSLSDIDTNSKIQFIRDNIPIAFRCNIPNVQQYY